MTTMLGLLALSAAASAAPAPAVTTQSLVRQMVDLARFRTLEFPYKTVQFSSYDRQSDVPDGPGWFANNDGFGGEPAPNFEGVIREPGEDGVGEYLIGDVQGPGAVVRTWTPANEGRIRIYLDGASEPILEGPAAELLRRPWAPVLEEIGLDARLLEGTFYQREAGYCPIPFRSRCRIVWEGDVKRLHFYHVQIRHYEPDVQVVTFSPEELQKAWGAVQTAAAALARPDDTLNEPITETFEVEFGAGARVDALSLEGPAEVATLRLKTSADDLDAALRGTVMRIYFDGFSAPQVEAPIGDFFGAAPGVNPYDSLPFTVTEAGVMVSRFVMPFEKSARITFENLGAAPVAIEGGVATRPISWQSPTSTHFHARWRIDHGLTGDPAHPQDIPYLLANGRGAFVGAAAYIMNPNPVPSSGGNWWGEGDEKIFVDADRRPSTFGTGSEDYFNYGWSQNDIFYHPYCGQPRNDGPANRGHVTNFRWHILDPLPFKERLAFYMELLPHERTEGMSYARMTYYYAAPGGYDDHMAISPADAIVPEVPAYEPAARGAAANAVFIPARRMLSEPQRGDLDYLREGPWSKYGLRWTAAPGASLTLRFEVEEAGAYVVRAALGLVPGGARISAALDGQPLEIAGEEVYDLARPSRTMVRCLPIYNGRLEAGAHELTLTSSSESQGYAPIEYLWLQAH